MSINLNILFLTSEIIASYYLGLITLIVLVIFCEIKVKETFIFYISPFNHLTTPKICLGTHRCSVSITCKSHRAMC